MANTSSETANAMARPREWMEANTSVVIKAVQQVARRRRLRKPDADELLSQVFTHLLHDDCRVLRAFRGSGSHVAYVAVIAERKLMDLRVSQWGKWRPSAAARREGLAAVRFERLVQRDGLEPAQARAIAGYDGRAPLDLTPGGRRGRWFVGLEAAQDLVGCELNPFEQLMSRHLQDVGRKVHRRLEDALSTLPPLDRTILRLRHVEGLPISEIARRLRLDQRSLYSRINALHATLRKVLGTVGHAREVLELTEGRHTYMPSLSAALGDGPALRGLTTGRRAAQRVAARVTARNDASDSTCGLVQ